MTNSKFNIYKKKYQIVNWQKRIYVWILDMLTTHIFITINILLIYYTDIHTNDLNQYIFFSQTWRYFLLILINFLILIIYFIIIPMYFNGKTLWRYIFKLKLIKLKNINFIFCLIKREFLLWGILYFAYLIIGIVLLFNNVNDASNIISSILLTNKIDSNIIYLIIFYKIINTFTFFFILIILINSIYNGSNQNILDKLSLATIISDKQKKRKKTVQNIEVKYDLPGSDLNLKELFDDE